MRVLALLFATATATIVLVLVWTLSLGPVIGDNRVEAQVAERPNIVFVLTDDLNEQDMEQLAGIRTVMGSEGVTFNNAFVTYSLCCPSRASILRGQYGHNHNIMGNSPPQGGWSKFQNLGLENSTLATWLNDAGYQTKYIGQYMTYYNSTAYRPPGWDEWYAMIDPPEQGYVNDNGTKTTLVGHSTEVFADKASDFIRRSSSKPEPFFAMIGTRAPHYPPPVADRYNDRFAAAPLPRPPNFDEPDISDKPQWVQPYGRLTSDSLTKLQDQYRNRLRSMLSVEDLLRQTVTTLQETGELDNTYIFFTSDNGFHMGHHRLFPGGKWTPYEEDIGVPLMVRGPGVPAGATREHLVINSDFAPTIADLAGAPIPSFVDGRSFAPLLGATPPASLSWRHRFLQEGWLDHETGTNPDIPKVPTHQGVHTQRYVYVEYSTGEKELYDLSADPYQLNSLPRIGNESIYSDLGSRLAKLRACAGEACRVAEQEELDTTAPTVSSVTPADQTQNALLSTNVEATFSEPMDASTISGSTFTLAKRNADGTTTPVGATVTYDSTTKKATLNPNADLQAGANYTATVKGGSNGVKDVAGNPLTADKSWSFTVTATNRVEAETMTLSGNYVRVQDDANASEGKAVVYGTNGSASGSFDGAATSIILRGRGTDCMGSPQLKVYVDGTLKGTVALTSSTFADYPIALSGLSAGTHTLRISFENDFNVSGTCDRNAYLDYYVLTETAPLPDTTAPTVSSVTPADQTQNALLSTNVEATFSEPMDASTISGSTFTLAKRNADGTTTPVGATVTYDSTTKKATLNPNADLQAGANYTATVKGGSNGVKDVAGNPLTADKSWSFTTASTPTQDTTPPETTIDSGPSGTVREKTATFTFSSTEAGSTFQCKLDSANFSTCSSPKKYTGLTNSTHTFQVTATDAAGNTDATPDSRTWTVRR